MKTIDFAPALLAQDQALLKRKLPPKDLQKGVFSLFDKINVAHYLECYLSSSKIDAVFFLKLSDGNEQDSMLGVVAQ